MPPAAPIRSDSSIAADRTSGYHLLKIDGYSLTLGTPTGHRLESRPAFTLGGHRWRLRYYPNGLSVSSADFISVYLAIDEPAAALNKSPVTAQFKFSVVAADEPPLRTGQAVVRIFNGSDVSWGHHDFIKREILENSVHLRDDCFTIRCDVTVIHGFHQEEEAPKASPLVRVPAPDLHRHLAELLETKKGADVVFHVAGETFPAHRCVLAARSSIFSAELFGTTEEGGGALTNDVVHIHDMEPDVFRNLLTFIYTDSLPEPIGEDVDEEDAIYQLLLVAADRYGMERLKLMCEEELCERVRGGCAGTAATIIVLAEQHQCHGLRKACLDILSSAANRKALVCDESFEDLCRSYPSIIKDLIVDRSPA